MKELKFMKTELAPVRDILASFKLKGKSSRLRMRLLGEVENHIDAYAKEEQLLLKEYALADENEELVKIKVEVDGEMIETYDFEDEEAFMSELKILRSESITIDHEKFKEELAIVLDAIDNSEIELSGQEAVAHSLLYDKIDEAIN
ncbi:hypothetical protein [Exiguobacterium sp. s133]|uniref:hypothetical protein n=1 Tax=Exiguobacterium sp. s133 TaxID=2751213 RepID=UPI001BEA9A84|nr:hypothetical protein [Exiguobacterium sp. s133]